MVQGIATPPPTDGVVGKLTPEQLEALKGFWTELFRLLDAAPEHGSTDVAAVGMGAQLEQSDGDKIPKDDNAKERLKAEQETRDAQEAFSQHGSLRFMNTFWRFVAMDDPDQIALRFLRARKWSVTAGVAMLAACMGWRMSSDVEDIFEKGEEGMQDAEGFIKQMVIGKTYTQGTDRYGRPVVYIHVAKHRTFDQPAISLEQFVLFQMESVRCLFGDQQKVSMVFDMTGFGIRNMDWRCILFIVKCLEAYYPESLNVMLIHNAPWVFQGIWKLLAPMLDPVVRNKVEMTRSTEDLVVHIPKHHLVKTLGGSSEWKWIYPPVVPGENAPQKDVEGRRAAQADRDNLIAAYTTATRAWVKASKGASEALAEKQRKAAMLDLRIQYLVLDPFVRGRGAYHRNGNIVGNGLVFWEYPNDEGEKKEGEWEIRGHAVCREAMLAEVAQLREEIAEMRV